MCIKGWNLSRNRNEEKCVSSDFKNPSRLEMREKLDFKYSAQRLEYLTHKSDRVEKSGCDGKAKKTLLSPEVFFTRKR